jgi:hypothetical protein
MSDEDIVKKWIIYTLSKNDEYFDAYMALSRCCSKDPVRALDIIIKILQNNASDDIQMNLSAGPLEDLLVRNGNQIIDKVEEFAKKDSNFNELLGGVWKNNITDSVWERIEAVRNSIW